MKIDFKKEVLKRQDDLIKDLSDLIKINSELTTYDPMRKGAPFGEGNKEALELMLAIGKRDGFNVLNVDGFAGHVEYGDQEEYVAILGHLDVVPAGNDWTYPPYEATIVDGKMYGRGVEDDKGPTIAAYYAMKILKELKVPLSKRIKLIVGSDEESGSRCVSHYFAKHPEQPVSGFVPDADFPLIYAEKGITRLELKGSAKSDVIKSIESGFRANMVPDFADLVLNGNFADEIKKFDSKLLPEFKNNETKVRLYGKSAHGSTPELGENAVFKLVKLLNHLNISNNLTELLNDKFLDDLEGSKLGINITCMETGKLTMNLGILNFSNDNFTVVLDIRYPKGITYKEIVRRVNESIEIFDTSVTKSTNNDMLYVDPNSKLVKTLMDVYIKHSGDKDAKPIVIGGGTFARSLSNVVAYGPHFPGKPSFIHQKDEYILVDDLIMATIIYLEALYELAK